MALSNNDVFRRVRYALNLNDPELEVIFALAGRPMDRGVIAGFLAKEDDAGYEECPDSVLTDFLDGLILRRRGPRKDGGSAPAPRRATRLNNNDILKKLRIALELREEDLLSVMRRSGFTVTAPEINALFRQRDHRNYKDCGDQFLRNFIAGLEGYRRP